MGLRSVLSDTPPSAARARPWPHPRRRTGRQRAAAPTPSLASAAPPSDALQDALSACLTHLSLRSIRVCLSVHNSSLSDSQYSERPNSNTERTFYVEYIRSDPNIVHANRTTRDLWTERLCAVCCILILCMLDVMACHLGVKLCTCTACWFVVMVVNEQATSSRRAHMSDRKPVTRVPRSCLPCQPCLSFARRQVRPLRQSLLTQPRASARMAA